MPGWTADSSGNIRLQWSSLDDFLAWVSTMVAPSAAQYGYKLTVEPIPKTETAVDRA